MSVFIDHAHNDQTWWRELAPYLSSQAQQDYQGTDPALVPARRVTGSTRARAQAGSGYLATATVPTDAGVYTLLLSRQEQGATWLVERITPPKGSK